MKRIAILSDTHGTLRPEVKARLTEADVIIHAGRSPRRSIPTARTPTSSGATTTGGSRPGSLAHCALPLRRSAFL